jgi:hypothetical protein
MTLDQPAASKPFDGPDPDNRPDDGWEVRGQVNDGASALSFAMCTKGEKRYVANDHGAFGLSRVKADCPGAHWHVTGGGGSLGNPASSTLLASFPVDGNDADTKPDDGWEAWGYAQPQDKIHAFAVCSRKKPVYREGTEALNPGSGSRNEAMCGEGHHLLGVGGQAGSDPSQTARVVLAVPDDFNRDQVYDEAGATFGVNDLGAQDPVDSIAYAICTR